VTSAPTVAPTARLVAGVEVDVSLTVNCTPLPGAVLGPFSHVAVEQKVGKSIAFGEVFPPEPTCDGLDHTLVVQVFADPSGAPFKAGKAVVTAVDLDVFVPSTGQSEFATVGPVEVTIKR